MLISMQSNSTLLALKLKGVAGLKNVYGHILVMLVYEKFISSAIVGI